MDKNFFGKPVSVVLTENRIEQPVFRTSRMTSTADIPKGYALIVVMPPIPDDPNVEGTLATTHRSNMELRGGASAEPAKGAVYIIDPEIAQ